MLLLLLFMVRAVPICFAIVVGMLVFFRVPVDAHILYVIPILITVVLFTFGCCCILLHLGVFIEDMSNVINIALRLVFYLTGIFYNIRSFPEPYQSLILRGNPLALLITGLRDCVLYKSTPDMPWLGIWFLISLALSVFGIWNIYKNENTYVKVI